MFLLMHSQSLMVPHPSAERLGAEADHWLAISYSALNWLPILLPPHPLSFHGRPLAALLVM
jgi:hypothetical protein